MSECSVECSVECAVTPGGSIREWAGVCGGTAGGYHCMGESGQVLLSVSVSIVSLHVSVHSSDFVVRKDESPVSIL